MFNIDVGQLIVDAIQDKYDLETAVFGDIEDKVADEIRGYDFDGIIRDILKDAIDREVGDIAVAVHEQIENELKSISIPDIAQAKWSAKNKLCELIEKAPRDAATVSWGDLRAYFVKGISDVIDSL